MTATMASHLEGKIYEVEDTVHDTGTKVLLRCVRNDSGSAITVARQYCGFDNGALEFGGSCDGYAASAGEICKPMDDAYTAGVSIPSLDLFWLLEEGPCTVVNETSSVSLTAHESVATDAAGATNGAAAAAGEFAVGVIDQDQDTADAEAVVWVERGLRRPT